MADPKIIDINEYDYLLPDERIAQYPLAQRDESRLLVYKAGLISESTFNHLPQHLPNNAMLVFNNSRVIRARLVFKKRSGARIEVFCLEPDFPTTDLHQAFASRTESHWKTYVGNLKKWKHELLEMQVPIQNTIVSLWAQKTGIRHDIVFVKFTWSDTSVCFGEIMEAAGHVPLPPYIHRSDDELDKERYQTIFATEHGSVAAPTAGLHFTTGLLGALAKKNISQQWITLHVGAGTFKPVGEGGVRNHEMHQESYFVTRDMIEAICSDDLTIIPVGTTSMRTLESLYWVGAKILRYGASVALSTSQWEPYENNTPAVDKKAALQALLNLLDFEKSNTLHCTTSLLIAPGYKFRICNGLITNFHMPKSTLLLLVAALVGSDWKKAYQFALDHQFRFLSYGDACLFLNPAE